MGRIIVADSRQQTILYGKNNTIIGITHTEVCSNRREMQHKKAYMVIGLFALAALLYHVSGYLLGASNAVLVGAGISVSTNYDIWITFFAFLSGIMFACGMILLGVWIIEQKERIIGSAKKILS